MTGHAHRTLEGLRGQSLTELADHMRYKHADRWPGPVSGAPFEALAAAHRGAHPEAAGLTAARSPIPVPWLKDGAHG